MAFSFGPNTPAGGAPAPAFGAAPAAPTAPATPAAPAFGAAPAAPTFGAAPAAPTFGAAPAAPAFGAAPANNAPPPLTGFGASNNPAPAAGGFSFGGTPAAPVGGTPATGFGGSTPAVAVPINTSVATAQAAGFAVPDFVGVFPYLQLLSKIRDLEAKLSSSGREGQYAAQELLQLLQSTEDLSNPPPPVFTAPNNAIRQQLQNNPQVQLYKRPAALTPQMLQQVFSIADELHLSEQDAMALYAQASQPTTRHYLQDVEEEHVLNDVPRAASALYFQQRIALLKSLIMLSQCRLEHKVLEATDVLLSKNLIQNLVRLIRKLTTLIAQMQQQQDQTHQAQPPFGAVQTMQQSSKKTSPWLNHLHQERQMAAECLFYLTYTSQCTADEIASLIDLIHELTNDGLSVLDPVKNVPDAHYPQPPGMQLWGPFTQALPPLKEKTTWEWESDLVKSVWKKKEPYVLQCTSVLIMAVLSALDTKQRFLNRQSHQVNDFGVGNALFRSLDASGSLDDIAPIHQRLQVTAVEQWKRKDIWGVLAAAYALSLRPVSAVVSSPRAQPIANSSIIKRTWKACLTAPSDHKSFTFVRLSLMPALSNNTKKNERCELHEFLLSVLSEFMSNYLDVVCASNAIPSSRSKWQDNETERLKIAREEQERNLSFIQTYGGKYEEKQIANEVNLLKRPDCIDDIAAAAVALCSQGPDYAAKFWTAEDYRADDGSMQTRCAASRALKTLEMLQDKDQSLIPTYVSFLAALAIAQPSLVFDLLSSNEETAGKVVMNWKTLFSTLRWYVRKMSDGCAGEAKTTTTHETPSVTSNGYYYGVDDYSMAGNRSTASASSSSARPVSTRLEELGEMNTAIVLSHLAVITKVAANYATGRTLLSTMKLSLEDETSDQEGDSVLVVLFSLAIAPLSPQVRGAVFATLASLLKLEGTNDDEEKLIRDLARKGWDLLELSQAVPVFLLDQYQTKRSGGAAQAMTFPPTSLSAASSGGTTKAWLPADPKYGILFEMEHVESRLGCYPSTEGLLQLLTSLVTAAGCPSDVGQESEQTKPGRLRPGCTPYIEYVAYFVVPRALGSRKADDQLPFKTGVDSARLVARALEVVEAVLTRYAVPLSGSKATPFADELKHQQNLLGAATALLRLPELTKSLMLTPTESDMKAFVLDFDSKKTTVPFSDNAKAAVSLPRVKSPGYTILADILSTSDSELLRGLALVLTQDGGCEGVHKICGQRDFRYGVTLALFGDTAPSVATAKHKQDNVPSFLTQSLLRPLLPSIDVDGDLRGSMDAVYWRAKSIATSLRILGAAAAKEREFVLALGGVTTIIPALQFKSQMNVVQKKEVHLTSVRDALMQSTSPRYLPSVTQYLASISSNDVEDSEISGTALALLMYCSANSSASSILSALDAQSVSGELCFVRAVAERLTTSSKRTDRRDDADIVRVILDLLQSELSHVLLGFPHKSIDGLDAPGVVSLPHASKQNECFSVLLDRLSDDEFLTNPSSSAFASTGFEIIYNLMSSADDSALGRQRAAHLSDRLKARDFWNAGALRFLASRESGDPSLLESVVELGTGRLSKGAEIVLHGAAWFLNGLAIHCAQKVQLFSQDSLSAENQRLLSNLLDKKYHLLVNALNCVPLRNEESILAFPQSLLPLQNIVESCMYPMGGRHDHVVGNLLVNVEDLRKKLGQNDKDGSFASSATQGLTWAEDWNEYVQRDCAATHLSSATVNLIEAGLDFTNWTIQSGVLLHSPNELSSTRHLSLLILLDRMVDRLIEDGDERVAAMPSRLLKSASINLSTEVLLLVDRVLTTSRDQSHIAHFVHRIGLAAMSSLSRDGSNALSTADDEERSILLGSALVRLLEAESVEVQDNTQDLICAVAVAFADLSSRSVNVQGGNNTGHRYAEISRASRSILASLIGSLDTAGSGGTNSVVATLATSTSSSSTSKTTLRAIIQLIPTLDDNVCLLLEKMACSEGGANLLINAGVMDALSAAANSFNKMQGTQGPSLDTHGHHSFLASNLSLLRSLLASEALFDKERDGLRLAAQKLMVSYSSLIVSVCEAFPALGDTWLEIVQTLASAVWTKETSSNKVSFGAAMSGMVEPPALSRSLDKIAKYVIRLTMNLVEYPFPERLQPMLPPKLRVEAPPRVWWETVEQEYAANPPREDMTLPSPPTGLTFGWSLPAEDGIHDKYGPWTRQKYEACLAAARVVDASLTFIIERTCDGGAAALEVDVASVARGLCRLTDSSRAMSKRLRDIEEISKSKGNAMDIGAFDSHSKESMLTEVYCMEEICPIFGRCCEKLLVLGLKLFNRMKAANEESFRGLPSVPSREMQKFAELVLLALQHTRLATVGVAMRDSEGSEFSENVAKKLQDELTKIQK